MSKDSKDIGSRLRGPALDGAENKNSVDHEAYEEARDPDTEIRTDDEKDSLYSDGLDVEDDSETYADTHANKMPG
jgi:hypothetical protein